MDFLLVCFVELLDLLRFLFPTSLCRVLVFGCALPPASRPAAAPLPPASRTQLTHTQLDHTHNLSHTTCSHTTCHHTTCHHTTCHQTTYSHTHTHTNNLSTHTTCPHTTCHHTTCSHGSHATCHFYFAWQAWRLATSTFTLRGRRGTWRHLPPLCVAGVALGDMHVALMALGWLWWRAWFPVGAVVAAAVDVSGVALGDINLHFAGQAWRSTWQHGCALCVAGVALMALGWLWWRAWSPRLLTWQAWHLATSTVTLHGRRGTWRHQLSLCAAGVARGDIDLHFAWQAWHLWHWTGSGGALGSRLTPLLPRLLAWQAWHLATSTSTLSGGCGTWRHRPAFCVAAVVLGDIDLHFAWAGVALMALVWLWRLVTHNSHTTLSHISFTHIFVTHTHNFVTQNSSTQLCHAQLSHTHMHTHATLSHTTLSHTHTTLSHTIFYT